jgi:guanylate kinase
VQRRLDQVAEDVTHWAEYDYVLINRDLETSVDDARAILIAERRRRLRQPGLADFVSQFRSRP